MENEWASDDESEYETIDIFTSSEGSSDADADSDSDFETPNKKRCAASWSEDERLENLDRTYRRTDRNSGGEKVDDDKTDFGEWYDILDKDVKPTRNIPFEVGDKHIGLQTTETLSDAIDFFKLFFTDELIENIIEQTNKHFSDKRFFMTKNSLWRSFKNVTTTEMLAFIGLILNMGTMPLEHIRDYWTNIHSAKIPFFSQVLSSHRFFQIFWLINLEDHTEFEQNQTHKISHINDYLTYLDAKFKEYFIPGREIAVQEPVKLGRSIKNRPKDPIATILTDMKFYALVDSATGYIFSVLPYYPGFSSATMIRPELSLRTRIVLQLYNNLLKLHPDAKGYHMFTDDRLTNVSLAKELLAINCYLTGKINLQNKHLPKQIRKPNKRRSEFEAYRSGDYLFVACRDGKFESILSTFDVYVKPTTIKLENKTVTNRPQVNINYHKNISKSTKKDIFLTKYRFMKRTTKQWRKLFFWCFNASLNNSYTLYKSMKQKDSQPCMNLLKFTQSLVLQLVGTVENNFHVKNVTPLDKGFRLNGKLHIPKTSSNSKDCKVCSVRNKPHLGKRRQTTLYCDTCPDKPGVHAGNCFLKYHTLTVYKDLNSGH